MTMYVATLYVEEQVGPKYNDTARKELALFTVSGRNKKMAEERARRVVPAVLAQTSHALEDQGSVGPSDVSVDITLLDKYIDNLGLRYVELEAAQDEMNKEKLV